MRCFVEPYRSQKAVAQKARRGQYFYAKLFTVHPVLADIHGAAECRPARNPTFSLPIVRGIEARASGGSFQAALTFITTPNAPSGRAYSAAQLEAICRAQNGIVVLDEAYVDFARENALKLALEHPRVMVARTFSKAYSLCFQRIGYLVGHAELIAALDKIRDSYNVNGLGQIAALATLDEQPYYRATFRKIIATRERLSGELSALGFQVFPSETNFILVRPPKLSAPAWLQKLREEKILVRWFGDPTVREYLRITIGTSKEAAALVKAATKILRQARKRLGRVWAERGSVVASKAVLSGFETA